MKKVQVALAAASLFAAAGSTMAASISQSGLTIAREVISANTAATQTLRAPTVTFNFDNGPAANATSTQDFNVTLTLGGDGDAKWDAQLANYKTVAAYRRNNGNAVVPVLPNSAEGAIVGNKVAIVLKSVDVVDAASKTYRFKFRLVNTTASTIGIGDLQLNFNGQNPGDGTGIFATGLTGAGQAFDPAGLTAVAADYAQVKNLAAAANGTTVSAGAGVVGDADGTCGEGIRKITVTARNYIGSGDGVEGESANSAANITNNGYIQFSTALRVQLTKGVAIDRNTDPLNSNQQFTTNGAAASTTVMALGELKFSNRTVDAWDISQQGNYYKLGANDLDGVGSEKNGDVDVATTSALRTVLTASNGFVTGATVGLATSPTCAGAIYGTTTLSADKKTATTLFSAAQLGNAGAYGVNSLTDTAGSGVVGSPFNLAVSVTDRAYVCMQVPGNALIPQSRIEGTAELLKDDTSPDTSGDEQSNISCKAPLAGLGGGIKIDVRNYTEFPAASDWRTYVRVINNSETQTADVWAQYIRADGNYGRYVKLFDLPPRAARFLSDQEIAALMASQGADSSVGVAGKQGYLSDGVYANGNARLRISSEAASTLRVQNYLVNATKGLLSEISSTQGADFVNVEASSRDHIDQDAQTGIKK